MIIDTHAHCYWDTIEPRIDEVIASMRTHGVTHAIQIGCDILTTEQALSLARRYPDIFRATIGYHPEHAQHFTLEKVSEEMDILEKMIEENREFVVAIGECGIDYHYLSERKEEEIAIQQYAWKRQVEWGKKYHLPLVIHSRDARDDTLAFIKEQNVEFAIMHCFAEDYPFAQELMKHSDHIYFSFSGIVTYKNAPLIQEAAAKLPLDRILTETDAPFLSPVPVRGTVNEPANTRFVLEKICELRTEPDEVIKKTLYENAKRVFGI